MKHLVVVIAILFGLCVNAFAIDFSAPITNLKNEPMTERGADGNPFTITLGALATNALLASHEDERALPQVEKVKRFKLAMKLNDQSGNPAKDVSLTAAEIAEISKLVSKLYSPLVVGKILQLIDPESLK